MTKGKIIAIIAVATTTTLAAVLVVVGAGGNKVKFITLPGVAHDAWDYAYTDREMFSWMFSQSLNGNQELSYTYRNYLEIVSPDKSVIFAEDDIEAIEYVISSPTDCLEIKLFPDAQQRLLKEYKKHPDGTFTIKYC